MSLKHDEERIIDLIEREPPKPIPLKRHVSFFKQQVKTENDSKKKARSTMGNAEELLPAPNQYLRKYSRVDTKKETDEPKCLHMNLRKPKLPDPAAPRKHEVKNFVATNVKAVNSAPIKYKEKKIIDSHKGTANPFIQPKYIFKKNYGVPPLQKRSKSSLEIPQENVSSENKIHRMSKEEREHMLEGLQQNLRHKNADFLLLPVIIDTPYLINRKKRLENEIKQIEKDLHLITTNFEIYITDD